MPDPEPLVTEPASAARETDLRRLRRAAAIAMILASSSIGFLLGRASVWLVPFDSAGAAVATRQPAGAEPAGAKPSKPVAGSAARTEAPAKAHPATGDLQRSDAGNAEKTPAANALASAQPAPVPTPLNPAASSAADPPAPAASAHPAPIAPVGQPEAATASAGKQQPSPDEKPAADDQRAKPASPAERPPAPAPREPTTATPGRVVLINPRAGEAPRSEPAAKAESARADGPAAVTGAPADPGAAECERRYSSFRRSDGTYQPFGSAQRVRCPHLR
jgi:hypothetical protein